MAPPSSPLHFLSAGGRAPAPRSRRHAPFLTGHAPLVHVQRRLAFWLDERAHPQAILVTGPEGAGKSALVEHTFERRERKAGPWLRIAPGAFRTGRKLQALLRAQPALDLVLDDVDELPRTVQTQLAEMLAGRKAFTILTGRLECDESVAALGLAPSLLALLDGTHLHVPGLCQRLGDVAVLAPHFLGEDWTLDDGALAALASHSWPENARELRAVLLGTTRLAQRAGGARITRDMVETTLASPSPLAAPVHAALLAESIGTSEALEGLSLRSATRLVEAAMIARAMKAADGNVALAGRRLRMPHSTLKSRLDALAREVRSVVNWVD